MANRKQRELIDSIKTAWLVEYKAGKVREAKSPTTVRSRLTTSRDGARSDSVTNFDAHVELSADGAYIVWETGTKKRGNRWRTRLPLEKLREWDEIVRTASLEALKREKALAELEAEVWEQSTMKLTDFGTHQAIKSSVRGLIRQGPGKRKR